MAGRFRPPTQSWADHRALQICTPITPLARPVHSHVSQSQGSTPAIRQRSHSSCQLTAPNDDPDPIRARPGAGRRDLEVQLPLRGQVGFPAQMDPLSPNRATTGTVGSTMLLLESFNDTEERAFLRPKCDTA